MLTYFTGDGKYGNAENITVIDTSDWTETEWEKVKVTGDNGRVFMARMISFTKQMEKNNVSKN